MLCSSQDHKQWSTRRREYHLTTAMDPCPRWNYARITVGAAMAVKRPPVMISPPAGCQEELQKPPELGFQDDDIFGKVSWKIISASEVLGRGVFVGEKGAREEAPGPGASSGRGPTWARTWGSPTAPGAPLRPPFRFRLRLF